MRRRRLGLELRRLRETADLSIERVGANLRWSVSKISRIETGQVAATPEDVEILLELYRVTGDQRERLIHVATAAGEKGWWQAYTDTPVVPLVGLEAEAASMRIYEGLVVPGLFQTKDYAEAVIHAVRSDLSPDQIKRWVQLRWERRQFRLGHDDSPEIAAVIDEAALRRPVAGSAAMRRQLRSLAKDAELPSVTLQILPFGAGEHAGMSGAFTVFNFSDPIEPDVVYLEHVTSDVYLEDAKEVERYTRLFSDLCALTLSPESSIARFITLAESPTAFSP
jgi:transcriptional regulator with XRE-family HTH domain